ncbi:MAG: signal peptide peptidase SppA [Balneolales bacterium]|nr:signal peptide peptidase SppA [Balneolales bacterium]
MSFIKNTLSVLAGLFIFFVVFFFFTFMLIVILSPSDKVVVENNSILHLNLSNVSIAERSDPTDFPLNVPVLGNIGGDRTVGLDQLRKAIRTAAYSDKIDGIYLQAGSVSGGGAMLEELRKELLSFKESGKFIISYSQYYSESGYYLSSVADELYVHPFGGIDFSGLSAQGVYLKGMLDKLEITPEVFVVGEFKSAVETFTRTSRSAEDLEQTLDFLTDLNRVRLTAVAESRDLPLDRVQEINDNMLAFRVENAVEMGLADGIMYDDEIIQHLLQKTGLEEEDKDEPRFISASRLNQSNEAPAEARTRDRIAIIYASGEIGSDKSSGIQDERLTREIRRARTNDNVKAVVLRVDTPGGGVTASEVIRRELEVLQQEKPLIISMGNVAASGGYWISMPANSILAQENTITGSIGIFGLFFNVEGLLNNQLEIRTDAVSTGRFSDLANPTRRMMPAERAIIQDFIEDGYDRFISTVSDGRNMPADEVRAIAEGRVYAGNRALELGLVDAIGGLDEALALAADLAGLETFRTIAYPEKRSLWENILEDIGGGAKTARIKNELGPLYPVYEQMQQVLKYEGVMARMPYDVIIN